jgi:hypothetical protein
VQLLSDIPSVFLHVRINLVLAITIYSLVITATYLLHRHIKSKKLTADQVSITP